jgi:hypothetical protein
MAVTQPISCFLNEQLIITDIVTTNGQPTGKAVNLTGHTVQTVVHKLLGDNLPLFTYAAVINAGGQPVTTIPNADVRTLGTGSFWYYTWDTVSLVTYTIGSFQIKPV